MNLKSADTNNYEITFERDNFVSGSSDTINLADRNGDWAANSMFNGVADGPRVRINRAIPFFEWGGPEFKFNLKCKYQGGGANAPVEQTYEVQVSLPGVRNIDDIARPFSYISPTCLKNDMVHYII